MHLIIHPQCFIDIIQHKYVYLVKKCSRNLVKIDLYQLHACHLFSTLTPKQVCVDTAVGRRVRCDCTERLHCDYPDQQCGLSTWQLLHQTLCLYVYYSVVGSNLRHLAFQILIFHIFFLFSFKRARF